MGAIKPSVNPAKKQNKGISLKIKNLLLERGRPVFVKIGVSKVIVFGSVANGVCDELSDLAINAAVE